MAKAKQKSTKKMLKKTITRVEQDGVVARTKVTIRGDECPETGSVNRQMQIQMLSILAATPDLHICGSLPFHKMLMYYDGAWVIELVSEGPNN